MFMADELDQEQPPKQEEPPQDTPVPPREEPPPVKEEPPPPREEPPPPAEEPPSPRDMPKIDPPKEERRGREQQPQQQRGPKQEGQGQQNRQQRQQGGGEQRGERGERGERGGNRPAGNSGDRGPRPGGGERREGHGGGGGRPGGGFRPDGPMMDIDLEKLIGDSLYLDNQAHAVVSRLRDMDSGTKSQLRRFYNAVRRACRTPEGEQRQHAFVMLRARLAYTIARHSLRGLDSLEKLLLQVTRKNSAPGYERFRDLFEAIVAYNE
jgi:CRISPR type III-A-associated protein Csm2